MVEIVALFIAAVWGFYVFVYQERIKPALEQPNVQDTLNMSASEAGRNKELITIESVWKNLGSVDMQVDGYILNVYGVRYSDTAPRMHVESVYDLAVPPGYIKPVIRTRDEPLTRTLLLSRFKPWNPLGGYLRGYMTPGEELHADNSLVVRRGTYDTLVAQYGYCVRRRDDAFRFRFEPRLGSDGAYPYDAMMKAERALPGDPGYGCIIRSHFEYAIR